MRKETRECLLNIRRSLSRIRNKALPVKTRGHYTDYDWHTWNNPIDGLDYSIHLIDNKLGKKVKLK